MRIRSIAAAITCVVLVGAAGLLASQSPALAQPPDPAVAATLDLPEAPPIAGAGASKDIPAPRTGTGPAATGGRTYLVGAPDNTRAIEAQYAYKFTILSILIAAVIIIAFCFMYFTNRAKGEFSRHYIVIVVVVSAIFLLVMGYTEKQVAPAFGLLGTILGYVFGRGVGGPEAADGDPRASPPPAGLRRERPATLADMDTP